jgi:hypothetical protein
MHPGPVQLSAFDIFGENPQIEPGGFLTIDEWTQPVTYFVGRNGSGKSRTGRALASNVVGSLYLSTDRLLGWMKVSTSKYGANVTDYEGVPLSRDPNASVFEERNRTAGMATEQLLVLRDQPEVGLRVAAFIQKALGRTILLRESAGFLDPFVQIGSREYSLLRDEGHGLRELVVLLTALYRQDWALLVVDEPELHLHPSMTRLWIAELNRECAASGRNAVVITHEPTIVRPKTLEDLGALWFFDARQLPATVASRVGPQLEKRIQSSLQMNPQLLSQLVFAPRPVLVEGPSDVVALTTAISRLKQPAVVAQTEFVPCGSSNNVAMWFSVARNLGLDVLAVADLDAIFNSDVQKIIDRSEGLQEKYRRELFADPPMTHVSLRPIIDAANSTNIPTDSKSRASWLAGVGSECGAGARRDKLIDVWREEGLWLHPQGTLEDVLGIEKGKADVAQASSVEGNIDLVVEWCAFELDTRGELGNLLQMTIERLANGINQALALNPEAKLNRPVGPSAESESRLVSVEPLGSGRHRLVVKLPPEFEGYFLDFDRSTPASEMILSAPLMTSQLSS